MTTNTAVSLGSRFQNTSMICDVDQQLHINTLDLETRQKNLLSKDVGRRASYLVALLQYLMMRVRKQQAARTFP